LLFGLVACGGGGPAPTVYLPDAGPETASIDVVVDTQLVTVFLAPRADCRDATRFPEPGTCEDETDVIPSCELCPIEVALDGARRSLVPRPIDLPHDGTQPGTLEITGCGATATIALPGGELPATTQPGTLQGDALVVAWDAPPTASTTLLSLNNPVWTSRCHADAGDHFVFTGPLATQRELVLQVQPLLPVATTTTAFGPVRVWRGASTTVDVPP
jgi:hypothetical protein